MTENSVIVAGTAKKSVCLLSLSRIPDDPRVRRQGDALSIAGWEVCGVGLSGAMSARPGWTCHDAANTPSTTYQALAYAVVPTPVHVTKVPMRAAGLARNATTLTWQFASHAMRRMQTAAQSQKARFSLASALKIYWSWSPIQELHKACKDVRADLWVANDWQMLPLAARLAEERGGTYVYTRMSSPFMSTWSNGSGGWSGGRL